MHELGVMGEGKVGGVGEEEGRAEIKSVYLKKERKKKEKVRKHGYSSFSASVW